MIIEKSEAMTETEESERIDYIYRSPRHYRRLFISYTQMIHKFYVRLYFAFIFYDGVTQAKRNTTETTITVTIDEDDKKRGGDNKPAPPSTYL